MRLATSCVLILISCCAYGQTYEQHVQAFYDTGPVAHVAQPDAEEISCHVQEVKLGASKRTSEWQPWIRVSFKDGKVWTQKRRLLPRQIDAIQECQAFVELASFMRTVNEAQAKHSEEMTGEYGYLTKALTDLHGQIGDLQTDLAGYKKTQSDLIGRLEALQTAKQSELENRIQTLESNQQAKARRHK